MGTILRSLGNMGYGWAYRVCDAQWWGVPQRRRRVFIVGCLGDGRRAAEVLFERNSLPWDSPPSRQAKSSVAGTIDAGSGVRRGAGINPGTITPDIAAPLTRGADSSGKGGAAGRRQEDDFNLVASHNIAMPLLAKGNSSHREDAETYVAHTLRAEGHDASEDGTGRGVPLVVAQNGTDVQCGEQMGTLKAGMEKGTTGPLVLEGEPFAFQTRCSRNDRGMPGKVVPALTADRCGTHADSTPHVGGGGYGVRRLMPVECERLQGFPDDWTRYDAAGNEMSDSARYRALGNAVCVNVAQWIGERIMATQ